MSACLYLNSRNNNNICDPRRQGMQPVQHTHTLKKQLIQRWKNSEGKCSSPMTTASRQERSWSRKQKVLWRQERSSPRSRHLPSAIFLFFFLFYYMATDYRVGISSPRKTEFFYFYFVAWRWVMLVATCSPCLVLFLVLFFKSRRQSLWQPLVAMFLNLNLKVAMGL